MLIVGDFREARKKAEKKSFFISFHKKWRAINRTLMLNVITKFEWREPFSISLCAASVVVGTMENGKCLIRKCSKSSTNLNKPLIGSLFDLRVTLIKIKHQCRWIYRRINNHRFHWFSNKTTTFTLGYYAEIRLFGKGSIIMALEGLAPRDFSLSLSLSASLRSVSPFHSN